MGICKCLLSAISLETKNKMEMTGWKDGDKETVFVSQGEPGINSETSFFTWYGSRQITVEKRPLGSQ